MTLYHGRGKDIDNMCRKATYAVGYPYEHAGTFSVVVALDVNLEGERGRDK